jgi:hypothetical protein
VWYRTEPRTSQSHHSHITVITVTVPMCVVRSKRFIIQSLFSLLRMAWSKESSADEARASAKDTQESTLVASDQLSGKGLVKRQGVGEAEAKRKLCPPFRLDVMAMFCMLSESAAGMLCPVRIAASSQVT